MGNIKVMYTNLTNLILFVSIEKVIASYNPVTAYFLSND